MMNDVKFEEIEMEFELDEKKQKMCSVFFKIMTYLQQLDTETF
jgi:hypothetical protein